MSTATTEAPTSDPITTDPEPTHGAQPPFDASVSTAAEETAPGPEAAAGAADAGVTPEATPSKPEPFDVVKMVEEYIRRTIDTAENEEEEVAGKVMRQSRAPARNAMTKTTAAPPLMTGKLIFRVDDCQVNLQTFDPEKFNPEWQTQGGWKKTGTKQADLEITIDLDELRRQLIDDTMRTRSCRLTRCNGATGVRPVKETVKVHGTGEPR